MNQGRRERKVVSVLFADLVGFTSRAESLDPEDVEAILRPYHDRLRTELERRGGTVEKFIGDAVMAVFGAPVAHEDDPERAVRAALAIRDWIREEGELEVRVAVNSGEALVSLESSPGAERGLVAGDVVNTASRLQTAAPVNGVLVSETTYNATARVIDYRELPPVTSKGKAEPIAVWEAVEARSRYGSDVTYRPRTALIGRERELDLLVGALDRVCQQSAPQLVTLVGVPGIGKTRLVRELFASVETRPELIYWRQGRSLPYGEGVAFWALGEIVKAHAGILEGEPEEQATRKLRAVVEEAVPEPEDATWITRQLGPLLGLGEQDESAVDRRTESFAAWRRFFEGLAELDPLVLVFEDLHWADEGLLDFVDYLVDWAGGVPILVVATARPELLTRRPGWGGGKSNAATISLSPLTEEATAKLLHELLDRAVLPADVQTRLLERAGGNPLYAEEFARIAAEDGAGELPLPESLHGLIAARLDSLDADEKALLQDAAVVGKVFWFGAVAAIGGVERTQELEERFHWLERREFVRRERRSSIEGDRQYAFAHTLVRDVAYNQIPRAGRAEKHRRAALWIESFGRTEDYADLRAHHYSSALEIGRAVRAETDELVRATRLALRDAGDRAASLFAFAAAARDYDRALELWPAGDEEWPRLLLSAAHARLRAEIWEPDELGAVSDALLAVGDLAGVAEAEILRAEALWNLGRGDEVLPRLERTAELAEALPTSSTKARVYAGLFRLHWLANRVDLAAAFYEPALAMAHELGLKEIRAAILSASGAWQAARGDPHGLDVLEESIRLFEELNSADVQRPYNNLADAYYNRGDLARAAEATTRMQEAWKRFTSPDWLRWADSQEIRLLFHAGRWDEALAIADRWIAQSGAERSHYLDAEWRWQRGRILLGRGDAGGALEESEAGLERAHAAVDPQIVIPVIASRIYVLWATGEDGAEELAQQLVEASLRQPLAVAHDWFSELSFAMAGLGKAADLDALARNVPAPTPWLEAGLAFAHGDPLGAAVTYREIGARPYEAESCVLAARDGLDVDLSAAIQFLREAGAARYLAEAEALLATSRSA